MTVVQKQPKTVSADELFTEDPDTPASEIVYDVMNMPTNGRLVSAENISYPRNQFTQKDVNEGKIVYFHDGDAKSVDDFYFRVSDGKYQPIYRHFRIHIIPLDVKLVNRTDIEIQQGTRVAYITSANLGTRTNGQRSFTYYNITTEPQGGRLYMNDAPASMFSQVSLLIKTILNNSIDPWFMLALLRLSYDIP
jgi:chondroitin sulfate proteoglycan 4